LPKFTPSKYAAKRKKRRAYTRTSAACCAVHATLACAWHTLSLFAFGDESYRPPRPLLASSLPPFCAFVKYGMRLLFSLEPLFSFRKRKARAQPITHTYKGKCMQAQTEVHVASGMYKCRGRGISRGGGCDGWWRRENRERRRGQEIHCIDSWRRRNAAEEETSTTKTVESVEKGRGAEDGPLRWPGEGAWESRTGVHTGSQLQRQSAAMREHDGAEEAAENGMRAVGQPVAPKEKRKPKKNTRRRMTAPRETQAKQLRQDAIGKRRAVETAGNAVSLTQTVTERRRCRKGGCNQGNSECQRWRG